MYEFRRPKQAVRPTRRLSDLTEDEQHVGQERVAICTIDGNVSEARAQEIAWEQIERERATRTGALPGAGTPCGQGASRRAGP